MYQVGLSHMLSHMLSHGPASSAGTAIAATPARNSHVDTSAALMGVNSSFGQVRARLQVPPLPPRSLHKQYPATQPPSQIRPQRPSVNHLRLVVSQPQPRQKLSSPANPTVDNSFGTSRRKANPSPTSLSCEPPRPRSTLDGSKAPSTPHRFPDQRPRQLKPCTRNANVWDDFTPVDFELQDEEEDENEDAEGKGGLVSEPYTPPVIGC
jgi:hypothetical protein